MCGERRGHEEDIGIEEGGEVEYVGGHWRMGGGRLMILHELTDHSEFIGHSHDIAFVALHCT